MRKEVRKRNGKGPVSYTHLGTEIAVKERISGQYESGHFCPIIERNTVIPASRTERFYTIYDDQTKISIPVLQGESRFAANNLLLGLSLIHICWRISRCLFCITPGIPPPSM